MQLKLTKMMAAGMNLTIWVVRLLPVEFDRVPV